MIIVALLAVSTGEFICAHDSGVQDGVPHSSKSARYIGFSYNGALARTHSSDDSPLDLAACDAAVGNLKAGANLDPLIASVSNLPANSVGIDCGAWRHNPGGGPVALIRPNRYDNSNDRTKGCIGGSNCNADDRQLCTNLQNGINAALASAGAADTSALQCLTSGAYTMWLRFKSSADCSSYIGLLNQVAGAGAPAVSAGDPHILRLDGTAFDIDTTGSYTLFNVAGGGQFSVKSTVARELPNRVGKYNMRCEFGGSWLRGQNVTAVGEAESGIYFDGHFTSISDLLQNTSQYTREFAGRTKMILEICGPRSRDTSDYCTSVGSLRKVKSKGFHAYMTMVTDVANITVRYSGFQKSHLDIYTRLQKDAGSFQIGGLLAGQKRQVRQGDSPLLASSVGAVQG